MSSGRLVPIPFALGQNEGDTPRELPMGNFREVVNIRQRRGKQFGMRSDYLAQLMTEFGGTLTPYDLYNLNGRLLALGNTQSLTVPAPTDLYAFVEQPGGAWKGTVPVGGSGVRVPPVTALRNIGQPPDTEGQVRSARIAANQGIVCMAYGLGEMSAGATSYVHIFRASDDATILFAAVPISNTHVVACGDSLWIVGVDASSDLAGYRFDIGVDNDLQSPVTLFAGTVTSAMFSVCDVNDIPVAQFAAFCRNGAGVTRILRFDESGTAVASFAGPAVSPASTDCMVIEADADANQIVIATRIGEADANVSTYNLTTNALVAGPTAVFGEAVTGDMSLTRNGLGTTSCSLVAEDIPAGSTSRVLVARFIASTIGSITILPMHNYTVAGYGTQTPLGLLAPLVPGVNEGDENNQLVMVDLLDPTLAYVAAQVDQGVAAFGTINRGGQVTQDRALGNVNAPYYWARILEGTDGQNICVATELRVADTGRRQAANIGNELFLSGAAPVVYDGKQVVESGFLERPSIFSATASNGAGSLTNSGNYKYIAVFKWTNGLNRLTQSRVSEITEVTMGASDDTVTLVIYAPHTLRVDSQSGSAATISLYRTETDGSIFQLVSATKVPLTDEFGEPITIVDTTSDVNLLDNEPLYTQGEDGPLTGVLQNDPAPSCRYCWTVGQRVFLGGLPDESEVAISKELAPAEALAFSEAFAFRSRVEGTVTAVAGLDGVPIAFTADHIYRFPGLLPSDNGAEGQLGPALLIPSEGGCVDWRSIIETSHGLFYKSRDGKLMLLPRGDGAPVWVGQPVRDALAAFPTITSTAYADEDHCVLFTCQNAAGTASTILVFDLRIGQWYRDTFSSAQVIKAATSYLGRLAYIDTATVRLQSSSLTPAAFIEYNAKTGTIIAYDRWGKIISITVEGEFRGNCQVRCRISYDDGVTFTNLATKTFTTAGGFVQGQSVEIQWFPRVRKCSSFVLDFQVLTNGTATEGMLLNTYILEVIGPKVGRNRTASTERG